MVFDIAALVFAGEFPTGHEHTDEVAIASLNTTALRCATSPVQALRLLVFATIDLAEQASNAADVLTAIIAMLREWRDDDSHMAPNAALDALISQGFVELRDMPVPPPPTVDEVIARSDEPTQPNRPGRKP